MDYSNIIKESSKNIADIFGLNPKAAAEGRKTQSTIDYYDARIGESNANTRLAEEKTRGEGANIKLTEEKAKGEAAKNLVKQNIGPATAAWINASSPEEKQRLYSALAALMVQHGEPGSAEALRDVTSLHESYRNPRLAAQQGKVSAAFQPGAVFSEQDQRARDEAQKDREIAVAQTKGSFSSSGGPDEMSPTDVMNETKIAQAIGEEVDSKISNLHPNVRDWVVRNSRSKMGRGIDPKEAVRQTIAGLFGANSESWEDTKDWFGEENAPVLPVPGANGQMENRAQTDIDAWLRANAARQAAAAAPGTPSAAAPAASSAPAPVTPPAAPTAAPAAQPPATSRNYPAAPLDKNARTPGQVYATRIGPKKWTGAGWIDP